MSNIEEPLAAETTALLGDDHDNPTTTSATKARYWAAIPVIFLAGLSIGPAMTMTAPFIKLIFCERGIPKYFPVQQHHNTSSPYTNDPDDKCDSAEYSAAIAKFVGINASLGAILVTLTVRFWSALSDRIGRKRAMLIWAIGTAIAQTMPLLVYYNKGMSVYFIWIGGMLEGSAGSILSLIALTHAYAADVTRPEERTVVFGRMIAGWYAGLGLGSALGGLVVKRFGLIAAFKLIPALVTIDIFYILLIPESLTVAALASNRSAKIPSSTSQATIVDVDQQDEATQSWSARKTHQGRLQQWTKSLLPEQLPNRLGGKYSIMLLMITCFLIIMGVMGAAYQISTYLLYRFHWSEAQLSYVGAIQGLSRLFSLTVLLPLVKRFSGQSTVSDPAASINFDLNVVVIGLLIEALTMFLYGVTTVGEGFYLGGVTGAIGSLFFPAIRGILSQSVAPELLGKTLGTLATFESLAAVVAPSLFAWLYGATLEAHPSAVFYGAAVLSLVASALALSVLISHRRGLRQSP